MLESSAGTVFNAVRPLSPAWQALQRPSEPAEHAEIQGQQPPDCCTLASLQALQRLTEAAEKAKIELSSTSQTSISLPFITATQDGPKHIETNLSRAKFEQLCSDLLDRCRIPVEAALRDAKLNLSDLNEVRGQESLWPGDVPAAFAYIRGGSKAVVPRQQPECASE